MGETQENLTLVPEKNNKTWLLEKIKDYERILEAMKVFHCDIDARGVIRSFDLRFCKTLDFSEDDFLGVPFSTILDDSSQQDFVSFLNATLKAPKRYTIRLRKDDAILDTEISAIQQMLDDGNWGYRLLLQDVSHRKKSEDLIRKLAFEDILTGLPNRRLFMDRLILQLNHAKRNKELFAVIMMDLDHFKEVNDTKGHAIGDHLIHRVARRLVKTVREGDTVARIGGDEFISLFPALRNAESGIRIAEKIIDTFKKPFPLKKHKIHITASIGVAVYPDHGDNIASLMRNSDRAMYVAKKNGRNRYEIYTEEMGNKA